MEALDFQPEPFEFEAAPPTGCGCTQCRQQEFEADDEWEWETKPRKAKAKPDPRARCSAETPSEVAECGSEPADDPIQCSKSMTKKCPALPETWRSKTIAGVRFFYGAKVAKIARTDRFDVTNQGTNKAVNLVPAAWRAAQMWVASMNGVFNMRISEVYHIGAGRYCRCVRYPDSCKQDESTWGNCRGMTISDHGFGDALDIRGVKWVDPKGVGSVLPVTVIDSWQDANQAALLIRINAAMRLAFHTVLDYSRKDHRNHFHCDMNQGHGGGARTVFGESPCEQNFIMSSLKRLNYLTATKPVTWARAKTALVDFAQVNNMSAPTSSDRNAWRPIVHRLYACVALGIPGTCAKP